MSRANELWVLKPKVLELWRRGATDYAIADALSVSRSSVQGIVRAAMASGELQAVAEPQDSGVVVEYGIVVPQAPENLGTAGKAVFRSVFETTAWLDPAVDVWLVEMLAAQYDRLRELEKAYAGDPRPVVQGTTKGSTVINPLLREIRQTEAAIAGTLKSLGLGPDSRIRLRTVAAQGDALKLKTLMPEPSGSDYEEDKW